MQRQASQFQMVTHNLQEQTSRVENKHERQGYLHLLYHSLGFIWYQQIQVIPPHVSQGGSTDVWTLSRGCSTYEIREVGAIWTISCDDKTIYEFTYAPGKKST